VSKYVAPSATVNFGERGKDLRVARERSTYFRENPQNISALAVATRNKCAV